MSVRRHGRCWRGRASWTRVGGGSWSLMEELGVCMSKFWRFGCRYVRSDVIGCWAPYQTNTMGVIGYPWIGAHD